MKLTQWGPMTILVAAIGCGQLGSMTDSDADSDSASSDITEIIEDLTDGTSNMASLSLTDVLNFAGITELGTDDDTSLTLTAGKSREQCEVRRIVRKARDEMNRVGAQVCLLEQQEEIAIPEVGATGNVFKIIFAKDPDEDVPEVALLERPPRELLVEISQPEDGKVQMDICDAKGPRQRIIATTDDTSRTGEFYFWGTDPRGIKRVSHMNFSAEVEGEAMTLDGIQVLENTKVEGDKVWRSIYLDQPAEADRETTPTKVKFSSTGTWRGGKVERKFGAAFMMGGYGEAMIGEISDATGTIDDAEFNKSDFTTAGTEAASTDLPTAITETPVDISDVPEELVEADLPTAPEITVCDATDFTEITISKADIDAAACGSKERKEPDCSKLTKAAKVTGLDMTKREKPSKREKPAKKEKSAATIAKKAKEKAAKEAAGETTTTETANKKKAAAE